MNQGTTPAYALARPDLPKTIFLDIDGTLLKHAGDLSQIICQPPLALPDVQRRLVEWSQLGYHIILMTGRPQSMRKLTQQHLAQCGIPYDRLLMGVGHGSRVLINDAKPSAPGLTAVGITISRDVGLGEVNLASAAQTCGPAWHPGSLQAGAHGLRQAFDQVRATHPHIVAVSGHFAPLHPGHIALFTAARKLGDVLVVIVNTDQQAALKGTISFLPERERLMLVQSLRAVDYAVLSIDANRTVCRTLAAILPCTFANGGDVTIASVREKDVCEELHIHMAFGVGGTEKVYSSSSIIQSLRSRSN